MMHTLTYTSNRAGTVIDLADPEGIMCGQILELRTRTWEFELGYRSLQATRPAKTVKVTKDTTYYVELQMMNNDGDWNQVDTIAVEVKAGTNYGFTPINGISGNQQYRLVCGNLTALLSK